MADLTTSQSQTAITRTKSSILRIAEAWIRKDSDKGRSFVTYLKDFLRLYVTNENTRRSYSSSILEFFDWYELANGSIPIPDMIERSDALRYAEWLRTRDTGIEEFRLHRNVDQKLEAAVYDFVKSRPGAHIADVRRDLAHRSDFADTVSGERVLHIEKDSPGGLDKFMACMVLAKILSREPTVEEFRIMHPELGMSARVDQNVFAYSIDSHTDAKGYGRSGTIMVKLNALSSFWKYVIEHTGENSGDVSRALSVNIWQDPLSKYVDKAASFREASRASKTPDVELLQKLIDTTGGKTDDPSPAGVRLEDVRDRAILLFFFYTGVRVSELGGLKRADVSGTPPIATVLGKGSKVRQFTVPDPAMAALRDLEDKIRQLAAEAEKRAPGKMPRIARLLRDDAPLFPAIMRWGCQAASERARDEAGLTRSGVSMMLRRRCRAAGIVKGTPEFKRVHSHGWRHLAAKTSIRSGVPINVVQASLGHRDLRTTSIYVEERDPRATSLFPTQPARTSAQTAPQPPAPRRQREQEELVTRVEPQRRPVEPFVAPKQHKPPEIIDVVGYEVTEPVGVSPAQPMGVLPEERLVAVGHQPEPRIPLPSHVEIEAIEPEGVRGGSFDNSYSHIRWGEKLDRSPIHHKKKESKSTDISVEEDMLTSAYVGNSSGLTWWAGPRNNLKPEMPIMSPAQIADRPAIRSGLENLWLKWVSDQEVDASGKHVSRGPTAASAMLEWFRVGLNISDQAAAELRSRGGQWIEYDAPKQDTEYSKDTKRFREHRDDKVLLWFGVRSYSFMTAIGREGSESVKKKRIGGVADVTTMPPDPPGPWDNTDSYRPKVASDIHLTTWFDAEDPIADLPPNDKAELFDWISVLTGKRPIDKTKRYKKSQTDEHPSLSRADLAGLVLQMCAYDGAEDDRRTVAMEKSRGVATSAQYQDAADASKLYSQTVDATVSKLKGKSFSFDISKLVEKRVNERKSADEDADKRRGRAEFYVGLLRELFGDDAANDHILKLYATCGRGHPLSEASLPFGGEYKEFFRVDMSRGTIVHEPEFAIRFARATGAHSECVARRIARFMWELRSIDKRTTVDRPDELIAQIANWAYFRVPCPATLEAELKDRLNGAPPAALASSFDAFAEEQRARKPESLLEARRLRAQLESHIEGGRERASIIDPSQLVEGFQIGRRGPKRVTDEFAAYEAEQREREQKKMIREAKLARQDPDVGLTIGQKTQKNYVANARQMVPGPITIIIWLHMYRPAW